MTTQERPTKPLGRKAYGSIGHMPGSRTGPGDWTVHEGQYRIGTERTRDRHDRVIVTEKLDGSCCAVARVDGRILALGRAGWLAETSPFEMHHLFATWVADNEAMLAEALVDGERMVGEWMAQAHGTRYVLMGDPFVPFDVIDGDQRLPHDAARERFVAAGLTGAHVIWDGSALPLDAALDLLGETGHHGAVEPAEGVVYRVERKGRCDFLMKYVRPGKVDGKYLPDISGAEPVWLWKPA